LTDASAGREISVQNIPTRTTERDLARLFARHGSVTSFDWPFDPQTQSLGDSAYVIMTAVDAATAVNALHGHLLHGQPLRVRSAPSL